MTDIDPLWLMLPTAAPIWMSAGVFRLDYNLCLLWTNEIWKKEIKALIPKWMEIIHKINVRKQRWADICWSSGAFGCFCNIYFTLFKVKIPILDRMTDGGRVCCVTDNQEWMTCPSDMKNLIWFMFIIYHFKNQSIFHRFLYLFGISRIIFITLIIILFLLNFIKYFLWYNF